MAEAVYQDNIRLNQIEYRLQHVYLYSMPRCLGLVLANACNIDCIHCYQAKNGDNLLRPAGIGRELRREFLGLYPYLTNLRIQGGETFAIRGFQELIDDVAATTTRPILSVSTNGTLIDENQAEKIVRTPFSNLTVSIDGATPETFARLRSGSHLGEVLDNIDRVRRWKEKLGSPLPVLDSFFVVMRSNFREIPDYLELMSAHGINSVCLQTMELNSENAGRHPTLGADEVISSPAEIRELHEILARTLDRLRKRFAMVRLSGLQSLFEQEGLDCSFLNEGSEGLYPASDELRQGGQDGFELCPNPWTTLFVVENGDVHLCFLAKPVGNLYEAPLAKIWNSPAAGAQRSNMLAGRHREAGCSEQWCSWREGKTPAPPPADLERSLLAELPAARRGAGELPVLNGDQPSIAAVRRMIEERNLEIRTAESALRQLEATRESEMAEMNRLCAEAQRHIDHLEEKSRAAVADFERLRAEFERYRSRTLTRRLSGAVRRLFD